MSAPRYSYSASLKSTASDELVNTWFIRPLAGVIVRLVFPLPITPNHLTIAAILVGFASAAFYLDGSGSTLIIAGLLLTLKDILDASDGQLARARQQFSRSGRFLDSIGDVFVNLAVLLAIGVTLTRTGALPGAIGWSLAAFVCLTLRVSYHVFYQTSYLHLQGSYRGNRVTEQVTPEDKAESDRWTLMLQQVFQALYGWQDRWMVRLDGWTRRGKDVDDERWFADPVGLRLSGLMGLGTELLVVTLCSLAGSMTLYLAVNLLGMNALWAASLLYRKLLGRAPASR